MYKDDLAASLAKQEALEKEIKRLKTKSQRHFNKKDIIETIMLIISIGFLICMFCIIINHYLNHRIKTKICNNLCLSSKEYKGSKSYIDYSHIAREKYIECKCVLVKNYELTTFYKVIPNPTNK